ncbi:uncharacterized protein LOC135117073 [Helicoverpa armigera]|uniref:uncharacterized protein LOC135117073 n=1 Tax=Helicoverpa armigera TaxID=29058 RepID=UPI003082FAFE
MRVAAGWCGILLMTVTMLSLALHLQNLEGNPGVLPVKQGHAYFQTDQWTIVKIISLDQIYTDLNYISTNYQALCNLIDWNASYSQEIMTIKMHTDSIRDLTVEKYQQLIPSKRSKRGLINPLGSIIKIVTGNLDHDDALKYDNLISKLNQGQITISKRLTLVSKMFDSFINATETIEQNTINFHNRLTKIETLIKDLTAQQNSWIFLTYLTGLFNVFMSNFRTIFIRLSEIETALALSRVSILHQSIVNSSELLYHLKLISEYESLIYPPAEANLLKIEEIICVKSFIKSNQITFIMEIPLTDNVTYNYYKIYSLPIFHDTENKTLAIFPKYPYLLAKENRYSPIAIPCRPFSAGARFLCTADNRIPFYEPTCVEQLMNFENDLTLCKQHPIEIEQVRVQQVANNNWILYSEEKTTLTERCKDETSRQLVFGTYLMTIEEPCEVEIHGIHINHRIFIESDVVKRVPIIALPQLRTNAQLSSTRALDMKGINLDEVKYMAYSLKHSEVIESVFDKRDSSFSASLVYVTLGLVILSIFVFSVYVVRLKLLKYTCFKKNYRNQSKIDSPDNFPLKVGGAMVTTQPSALD